MKHLLLILALLTSYLTAPVPARASYLEETQDAPPPPRIVPPPRPIPDNPLTDLVLRVNIESPYTFKGLTVFPLTVPKVTDSTNYLSLDEALRNGALVIAEKGEGTVPVLVAENRGKRFILLLAGNVLAGGKQNRILRSDVLLPPHSGRIELPVFCVERGRWRGRRTSFDENPAMAAPTIRAGVHASKSQEDIWSDVEGYQQTLDVVSETEDLKAVTDSPAVRRALEEYRSAFARRLPSHTIGVVVVSHWRIIGADLFCNPRTFRKHRDRLIGSYGLDCYVTRRGFQSPTERQIIAPVPVGRREIESFLRRVLRAEHTWTPTSGAGRLLRVRGPDLNGMALVRNDAVVHAGLFPQHLIRPLPEPGPIPFPLPPREFEE